VTDHDYSIPDADKLDYQYGKTLDVWSLALWLGAALQALKERAGQGDPNALLWIDRVPREVKAQWPGVFPEIEEAQP
jgi:hypothetical protein